MNNSFLTTNGKCLGYCSVIPEVGEGHMFGDTAVEFVYQLDGFLMFKPLHETNPTIENNHRYHAPKEGQPAMYEELRSAFKDLAYTIDRLCPNGRDRSVAFTNLETAQFWANASIART